MLFVLIYVSNTLKGMILKMNKDKVRKYIQVWLKNIDAENIPELEKDIEMNLEDFILDIINNLYSKYSDVIDHVPVSMDDYNNYIITPTNGSYSLEDFFLNRLMRSVTSIIYRDESNTLMPDSHYDHATREVLIDKSRMQVQIKDVKQKRKLVAHEFLHGIKTQFYDGYFFQDDRYESMKKDLRNIFGTTINSFDIEIHEPGIYDQYKHSGITYSSRIIKRNPQINFDSIELDEILNDKDAMDITNDDYREVHKLSENCYVILNNPESSNTFITNYAHLIERLVDKNTLFVGLYLEPVIFYDKFNSMYTSIFQKHFSSDLSAMELLSMQLKKIKHYPNNIEQQITLLNTFYDCFEKYYIMTGYNDEQRIKNIGCLGNKGILEISDGKLQPFSSLDYCEEYNSFRRKTK